jgi:hypothetical protein
VKIRAALSVVLSVTVLSLIAFSQGAQPTDPVAGTWELNLAKSKIVPGPAPKSETRVYAVKGNQITLTLKSVEADGRTTSAGSTYVYDSKDYAVTGNPDIDMQAITQVDRYTITSMMKKSGKVVQTGRRFVSTDGKMLTVIFKGTNTKGQTIDEVRVYDRR